MSAIPPYGAEERWRRTVDNRHRPLKLKVGRLLREFGYARLDPDVTAAIEARLERVGLCVQPPLHTVAGDQIITLELLRPAVAGTPYEPITNEFPPVSAPDVYQPFVDPPGQGRLLDVDQYTPDSEQARLVRAAVEAEQRAREAYDQAAAAAADRIAALERELAAERQAKARTDDQSIEIRQRIDLEREDATARLADLAASERAASDQLDAERARISEGEERRRRPFSDIEGPIQRAISDAPAADDGGTWNAAPATPSELARAREPAHDAGRDPAALEPSLPASERVSWHPAPVVVASDQIAAERLPREGRARLGMLLVGLIALAALAAAGYAVGHGDEPSAPAEPALAQETSRAGVKLRFPAGWVRVSRAPRIPGLRFTKPIALSTSDGGSPGLVAGVVKDAVGSDLLPASLRRRLPAAAPAPQPVRLGDMQALSYPRLKLDGFENAVTLYAVPTADGSAVVACVGPAEASEFFDACGRAAATLDIDGLPSLRIDGARALPLGAAPGYGHRVADAVSALDTTLRGAGEDLRKARTATGQAKLATAIARSYARTASELDAGAVSARDREGHDALVAAIRSAGDGYKRLASAARDRDGGRYGDAAAAVRSAEGRLRQAVAALGKLGYAS
jgi:hypothetical protein